jgi:hypothetical protein
VPFESQSEECLQAIVALKDAITSEAVLMPPREDKPFFVKTDGASTLGIGGVLTMGASALSRTTAGLSLAAEKNWTVTEIELLHPYLKGRRFKLIIDHAALKWLHSMKTDVAGGPASGLTRGALKLSEYNFEVEHKPGANHSDADAISRLVAAITRSPTAAQSLELMGDLPAEKIREATSAARRLQAKDRASRTALDTKESILSAYLDVGVPTANVFRRELDADAFARDIMDYLLVKLLPDDPAIADSLAQDERIRFKMMNGLLYYRSVSDSDDPATLHLYVPSSLRAVLSLGKPPITC